MAKFHHSSCAERPYLAAAVKERIAKLREEIAQVREANHQYLQGDKKSLATTPDHERRIQRLKDILDELASLTEWKQL
jgi:hypothetical protein